MPPSFTSYANEPPDLLQLLADRLDPPTPEWAAAWQERCEWWASHARDEQVAPPGDWLIWLILAGRGFGKTRTGAETVSDWARDEPGIRIAVVGQTFGDARDVMVEGESGLLSVLPDVALRGGNRDRAWNRSMGELFFANGSQAKVYSSEKPGQLRGPQHHKAWVDEPAKFKDARAGDGLDTTWNNLMLGLRLGQRPQAVVTGTPTPALLIRQLVKHTSARITRGSTYDNLANLAPSFRAEVLGRYEGTRLGRQELHGEILEDVEGALWSLQLIDDCRVGAAPLQLASIVVAIDPAGGTTAANDETGIIVAARAGNGEGYVLEDSSGRYSPSGWARKAMALFERHSADRIVAEVNYGGDMVEATLRAAGFKGRVEKVVASRGKRQRAEPIALLYDQGRIHHVGVFAELEDQMCTWLPDSGTSPDRMDALVWAFRDLYEHSASAAFLSRLAASQHRPAEQPAVSGPSNSEAFFRQATQEEANP